MCSGMVPPLAMALASTVLDRNRFTPVERENGVASYAVHEAHHHLLDAEGSLPPTVAATPG